MAEAAVAIVINKAIAAKALLEREEYLLRENLSWIETQMKTLQSYLKDAHSKNMTNFINSIRDLALELEDILDTHLPEIESRKSKGSFGFLKHPSCTPCCFVTDITLMFDIEKHKKRAAEIERSRGDIAAESNNVDGKFPEETNQRQNFVGRKETFRKIKEELLSGDQKCKLLSIVGDGGVGKTTLAREIYDQVKNDFDCSAMVYVSDKSTLGELLLDIARQVDLSGSEMKHDLQENLYHFLRNKRFLVFLDDVSDNMDVLDVLKDTLMTDSKNRSRVIVTCRVTTSSKLVFKLGVLTDSEGKELFYDSMEETHPPKLNKIGDKIVQKCGGLPLAIQVAAGMLKTKERSESSWNEVLERMTKEDGEKNSFKKILGLSYQDLPTKLKPFFLYFGIFPLNSEIFVSELIQCWVAEKLIQADESRKPEKVVEAYIDKLIARNLVQVSRRTSGGRVNSCSIQNLIHDFCTRKAEEINFFCNWNNLGGANHASTVRRVITNSSRSSSDRNNFEDLTVPKKLRALLCFAKSMELTKFIKNYASDLRFLRLLTIEGENIAINLPTEIVNLSGLVYLKVKGQFITIPFSIGRMKRLETLEVRTREVPESVLKMKHLKHLFIAGVIIVKPRFRDRQHEFEVDLQNLETLDFDYQYGYHLTRNSFKKLPSIRKLKVSGAEERMLADLTDTAPFLQKLEELELRVNSVKTSDIQTLNLSHYENLQTLYMLFDSTGSISCLFEFPKILVKVTFVGINIEFKDTLEKLRGLPGLKIIKLKNCVARKIDFSGHGSFRQLQTLMLWDTKFQQLVADEKGMPELHKFIYKRHPQQLDLKIPEKLKKVMVNNDDMIRSSISMDGIGSMVGKSWTRIRTLLGGYEIIKRVFG